MKSLKKISVQLLTLLSSPTVSTLVISSVILPSLMISILMALELAKVAAI